MISIPAPTGNNSMATVDYRAMRNALFGGSLSTAQSAYLRLQTDLATSSAMSALTDITNQLKTVRLNQTA